MAQPPQTAAEDVVERPAFHCISGGSTKPNTWLHRSSILCKLHANLTYTIRNQPRKNYYQQ